MNKTKITAHRACIRRHLRGGRSGARRNAIKNG